MEKVYQAQLTNPGLPGMWLLKMGYVCACAHACDSTSQR